MTFSYYLTGVGLLKVASGVIGFIALSVGLYSFCESDWRQKELYHVCTLCTSMVATSYVPYLDNEILYVEVNCPDILLEVFYIVTILCAFIISTSFIFTAAIWPTFLKNGNRLYDTLDMIFHGIFCPLIIASASTFIYSAAKIDQLQDSNWKICGDIPDDAQYLLGGKIVAGIFALKLGVLYGVLAVNIFRGIRSGLEIQLDTPFTGAITPEGP